MLSPPQNFQLRNLRWGLGIFILNKVVSLYPNYKTIVEILLYGKDFKYERNAQESRSAVAECGKGAPQSRVRILWT